MDLLRLKKKKKRAWAGAGGGRAMHTWHCNPCICVRGRSVYDDVSQMELRRAQFLLSNMHALAHFITPEVKRKVEAKAAEAKKQGPVPMPEPAESAPKEVRWSQAPGVDAPIATGQGDQRCQPHGGSPP